MMDKGSMRELVAEVQHEIWAHWMEYMFSQCERVEDAKGVLQIPSDKVYRWIRQMNTPYAELSDKERESDREQADKVLNVLGMEE